MKLRHDLIWVDDNLLVEDEEECPICREVMFEMTTGGNVGYSKENPFGFDPNRRTCLNCGHKWYDSKYLKYKNIKKGNNERTEKP